MFSVENSVRFMAQMAQGNKEIVNVIEEVSKDCEDIRDSDRYTKNNRIFQFGILFLKYILLCSCELAFKIMSCTEEGISKHQDELRKHAPQRHQ